MQSDNLHFSTVRSNHSEHRIYSSPTPSAVMSGKSCLWTHVESCCSAYRSNARMIVELLTARPNVSVASTLSFISTVAVGRVRSWLRGRRSGVSDCVVRRAMRGTLPHGSFLYHPAKR